MDQFQRTFQHQHGHHAWLPIQMQLVREANRDALNPYLMPGDAIACYDSRWTNFREAVGLVTDAVNTATPAILLDSAL